MRSTATSPADSAPSSPTAAHRVARALARPRTMAIACIAVLSALGWLYTGLVVAPAILAGDAAALGPGMGLFARLVDPAVMGPAWLQALCATPFAAPAGPAVALWASLGLVFAMWAAMTLAMMLPTAAPMLLTYAELAETAARQSEPTVSPLVLAAGFAAVWLGFAAAATGLYFAVRPTGLMTEAMAPASRWLAGLVFIGAGLYQFSSLKQACLRACRSPFAFFFANWASTPRAVFRLGLRQGLYCLGCCWAAMLVMFAVGLMNVVWMAGLGIVMAAEKMARGEWFTRVVGVAFLGLGAALAAWAAMEVFPR